MGINNYITDSKNKKRVQVVTLDDVENSNALIVATHPLSHSKHDIKFFTNPIYGSDLNIAVAFGDSPAIVYAENSEWATSAVSGTWDFASTTQAQAGSVSVNATSTTNNNTAQFLNSSDLDLTNYASITGYIYITRWDASGERRIDLTGWDTSSDMTVGITVDIADYIDTGNLNVWQQFSIILSDMELSGKTIDALRITTVYLSGPQPPNYFIDTLQIEQKGFIDPQTFAVLPEKEEWLHVVGLNLFIANDSFDSTVVNNSVPKLPYTSLLGEALSVGLSYQERKGNDIIFNHIIRNLGDFLSLAGSEVVNSGSNGSSDAWMSLRLVFSEPILLKPEEEGQLCIVVSEDLSGIDVLKSSVDCFVENRSNSIPAPDSTIPENE